MSIVIFGGFEERVFALNKHQLRRNARNILPSLCGGLRESSRMAAGCVNRRSFFYANLRCLGKAGLLDMAFRAAQVAFRAVLQTPNSHEMRRNYRAPSAAGCLDLLE